MKYESAPNGVSYETLLKVIERRSTIGRPYEERLYLVDLSNTLTALFRKTKAASESRNIGRNQSQW